MRVFLVNVVNRSIYKRYENSLMLIYCIKLDHALYSMNYGSHFILYSVYMYMCVQSLFFLPILNHGADLVHIHT